MREILFRGFNNMVGEWFYGMPVYAHGANKGEIKSLETKDGDLRVIEPETVGQYIGLKDKNGKKYFIGDKGKFDNGDSFILKMEDWLEPYVEWVGEPDCADQARQLRRISSAEITGTIHDKRGE